MMFWSRSAKDKTAGKSSAKAISRLSVKYSPSPLLVSQTPLWRSQFLLILLVLAFTSLAVRAAYVQVVRKDFYQSKAEARFVRTLEQPATRGRIVDRNGSVLASSVPAQSVWAIPEDMQTWWSKNAFDRSNLAGALQQNEAEIGRKLGNLESQFVWIKRQIPPEQAQAVAALNLEGVHLRKESKRQYPEGEALATIVGLTNLDSKGVSGMEVAQEALLAGTAGSRRVIKDRLGRVVDDVGEQILAKDGKDVMLSIDSKIQFYVHQELKQTVLAHRAKSGSVVVMDVGTGHVLAMTNYPMTGPDFRNRALADTFEPGSVMKPLTMALALERGTVKPSTVIQTAPGKITIGKATLTDAHPHGALTVSEIIQKSSNVGTVKVAMQLPSKALWDHYASLGLGQKPQLLFPGAATGRLKPYAKWVPVEQATMSYGYGLSTSLFQLAQAYTVIANDGLRLTPSLLKDDRAGAVAAASEAAAVRILSPAVAQSLREMLRGAASKDGTGQWAQVEGYSVGGKTGTVHKQEGKGYAAKKYRSLFIGMAPITQPRIVVAVMIEEPSAGKYFGGDVAAPLFAQSVAQSLRVLGVVPDRAVVPQFTKSAVEESTGGVDL